MNDLTDGTPVLVLLEYWCSVTLVKIPVGHDTVCNHPRASPSSEGDKPNQEERAPAARKGK